MTLNSFKFSVENSLVLLKISIDMKISISMHNNFIRFPISVIGFTSNVVKNVALPLRLAYTCTGLDKAI